MTNIVTNLCKLIDMNVSIRQEAIVRSLRRNGTSTIASLAEDVGVSNRTILRDISALRDQGFVIYSEPGPGGGVQLDPQSILTTPRLTVSEVFALLISVASMRAAGNLPFSTLANAGLAKIEKALPADKLRDLRRFLDCLFVGELSPDVDITNIAEMDADLLPVFEQGFLKQQKISFTYRDAKGASSMRMVEPQAMLILPPLWYLVAWDLDRDDFRHFRMDRISTPKCLEDETFRKRHVPFDDHISPLKNLSRYSGMLD